MPLRMSAGGGTRTLTLFRTRAPKARVSANSTTPANHPIVPLLTAGSCRHRLLTCSPPWRKGDTGVRSAEEFESVQRLFAAGVNDGEISRQTRIPRSPCVIDDATAGFNRGRLHRHPAANDRGVRYHFPNRSDDIRNLFYAALDELSIPWTKPRWFEVAVYRRAAVARRDEFVGPKASWVSATTW
jgi:hypothetical protein